MSTLFELSEEMQRLADALRDEEGDLGEGDLEAWFDRLTGQIEDKVEAYCYLIEQLEIQAEARSKDAARIAKMAKTDQNTSKRLKDRLKQFLEDNRMTGIETIRKKVSIAKNGGAPPVIFPKEWEEDAKLAPVPFQKIVYQVDKAEILRALQAGESLEGCSLGDRGTHLRIK